MKLTLRARIGICVLGMVLMGGGLAAGQGMPNTANAEEGAVQKVLTDQVAQWNDGDIPGFMKGYWKSEKTEFVNASGIFRGWDNVLQRYLREYPDPAAMGQLTFSDLEINPLGQDSAYVLGQWRLERQSGPIGGVFTLIFRKFPDGWKIIHDHTSQYASVPGEKKP